MSDVIWRRLPSLTALRAFDATARCETFAEAARALNVTHAAIAQQVRGLEAELGVRLTQRVGRSIRLTAEGAALASALHDGFGRIFSGVEAARKAEQSRGIRVSATPGMTEKVLLPRLGDFWSHHPDIPVTIVPEPRPVDLSAEGFDLGLRAVELDGDMPATVVSPVVTSEFVIVGAPSLFADGPPDLMRSPFLSKDPFELGLLRGAGFDTDRMVFREVGTPAMESAAARMGYGLMICPEVMARDDLEAGALRRVPGVALGAMMYHAVTPAGVHRAQVAIFVAWLRAVLSGEDRNKAPT